MTAQQANAAAPAANENGTVDQDSLNLDQLAQAVLDREFRPRVASVRRLAEGVLARAAVETAALKPAKSKKNKAAKAAKSGKAGKTGAKKKAGGKKRKLAKIPGQKGS